MSIEAGVQFLLQRPLFARVFLYHLTITGSTVILKWSPWSLFRFTPLYHLTKGLWGVHFVPRGVHFLIIPTVSFASNHERLFSNNELQ